jgi:chromosome segregation protein
MGESSHKNMRRRQWTTSSSRLRQPPGAQLTAEVLLTIENEDRTAPAAFNDATCLEISRKSRREEGSTTASTPRGARPRRADPVRDAGHRRRVAGAGAPGQISEIISAKPQSRRRILEDAAGVAGLHARRHEAELRLKAAEDNLVRVEDVLRELDAQVDSLKKQGRQASRYKNVSAEIRRLEALVAAISYTDARDQAAATERQADHDLGAVADAQREQTEAATAQAVAAHSRAGTSRGGGRCSGGAPAPDAGAGRARGGGAPLKERLAELERQIVDIEKDIAREAAQRQDGEATVARLAAEEAELAAAAEGAVALEAESEAALNGAEAALHEAEAALAALQAQVSDLNARRAAIERTLREERERAQRFRAEKERVERDLAALSGALGGVESGDALREALAAADAAARQADENAAETRAALATARDAEARARGPLADAERKAQRLETEARTLAKLFAPATGDLWPPVLDQITVAKGFETALGAALGDDLDASTNESAPAHWAATGEQAGDAALPEGVRPLTEVVEAPAALSRRCATSASSTAPTAPACVPSSRRVSAWFRARGDVWRWDGYTAAAEAPSAAARRLVEKNRLGDLEREAAQARTAAERLRAEAEATQAATQAAAGAEAQALEAHASPPRPRFARAAPRRAERREAELASAARPCRRRCAL